ncbi:uncharacterized protein VTP21DRAFT_2709 [Calcarisporiella thermophila]|uniref:uncharacterized protein n=1 Tax=Calcarisporiella thermophila TaxID=911321 RepID=UPI003743AAAF
MNGTSRALNDRNRRAKLSADYQELLAKLSSPDVFMVGNYTLDKTIGEGSYGKVKLGLHRLTGQKAAIKKISKRHAPLITREIFHHQRLEHPNIVRLLEILTTENYIYVVTEYCPNGELFDHLIDKGRVSERTAQRWFRQLCSAVKYCHELKVVHRDLKLENILLDADMNLKLVDFSFSRECESRRMLDTFCGSVAYAAPEMIKGRKYSGPEADIWSLGVILYTLLCGYLPFDDDVEANIHAQILSLDYELPEFLTEESRDLISRILKIEPSERITMNQIMAHPWLQMKLSSRVLGVNGGDDTESCCSRRNSTSSNRSHTLRRSLSSDRMKKQHARYPTISQPSPAETNRGLFSPTDTMTSPPSSATFAGLVNGVGDMLTPTGTGLSWLYDEIPPTPIFPGNLKEQHLIASLAAAGLDVATITQSVRSRTSDPASGLWYLLLEKAQKDDSSDENDPCCPPPPSNGAPLSKLDFREEMEAMGRSEAEQTSVEYSAIPPTLSHRSAPATPNPSLPTSPNPPLTPRTLKFTSMFNKLQQSTTKVGSPTSHPLMHRNSKDGGPRTTSEVGVGAGANHWFTSLKFLWSRVGTDRPRSLDIGSLTGNPKRGTPGSGTSKVKRAGHRHHRSLSDSMKGLPKEQMLSWLSDGEEQKQQIGGLKNALASEQPGANALISAKGSPPKQQVNEEANKGPHPPPMSPLPSSRTIPLSAVELRSPTSTPLYHSSSFGARRRSLQLVDHNTASENGSRSSSTGAEANAPARSAEEKQGFSRNIKGLTLNGLATHSANGGEGAKNILHGIQVLRRAATLDTAVRDAYRRDTHQKGQAQGHTLELMSEKNDSHQPKTPPAAITSHRTFVEDNTKMSGFRPQLRTSSSDSNTRESDKTLRPHSHPQVEKRAEAQANSKMGMAMTVQRDNTVSNSEATSRPSPTHSTIPEPSSPVSSALTSRNTKSSSPSSKTATSVVTNAIGNVSPQRRRANSLQRRANRSANLDSIGEELENSSPSRNNNQLRNATREPTQNHQTPRPNMTKVNGSVERSSFGRHRSGYSSSPLKQSYAYSQHNERRVEAGKGSLGTRRRATVNGGMGIGRVILEEEEEEEGEE